MNFKWIVKLLESTTVGASRGIPIGPPPAHLLAEALLTAAFAFKALILFDMSTTLSFFLRE